MAATASGREPPGSQSAVQIMKGAEGPVEVTRIQLSLEHGRGLAIEAGQFIGCRHRRPDRIFDGKDDVAGLFAKLAGNGEIGVALRVNLGPGLDVSEAACPTLPCHAHAPQ